MDNPSTISRVTHVTPPNGADSPVAGDPPIDPMSPELITPDDYPHWVHGRLLLRSPDQAWDGAAVRAFRYGAHDVTLPPVRDYLVVAYHKGSADMRRRFDGRWSHESLGPGDVTLLTRAVETRWVWQEEIDVVHVHLTHDLVRSVCQQMYERDISDVLLQDKLRADDPLLFRLAMGLAREAANDEPGAGLLVDSLSCQLAVHLLRRHTEVSFKELHPQHGMPASMLARIDGFVTEQIQSSLTLQDLAGVAGLSHYHFARRFREATGTTPHEYVMRKRVEAAKTMLARQGWRSLAEIASACGFSDQSHMTRVFGAHVGTTPGRYRSSQK